ncbi:MAG TPA: hypothetical protein VH054_30245 [Polyangiaceae bacterium]|nr:hypothetical protein [Polyangiaceae bacterium]
MAHPSLSFRCLYFSTSGIGLVLVKTHATILDINITPTKQRELARSHALAHEDPVSEAPLERDRLAPHQARVFVGTEAFTRFALVGIFGIHLRGIRFCATSTGIDRIEDLSHALRDVPERGRR